MGKLQRVNEKNWILMTYLPIGHSMIKFSEGKRKIVFSRFIEKNK
jgi:hypothetical protein